MCRVSRVIIVWNCRLGGSPGTFSSSSKSLGQNYLKSPHSSSLLVQTQLPKLSWLMGLQFSSGANKVCRKIGTSTCSWSGQCSPVQLSAVQYSSVQISAVQWRSIQLMQLNSAQCSSTLLIAAKCRSMRLSVGIADRTVEKFGSSVETGVLGMFRGVLTLLPWDSVKPPKGTRDLTTEAAWPKHPWFLRLGVVQGSFVSDSEKSLL